MPDEATDRAFKSGGSLGAGRPFVDIKIDTVHLRIPCSSQTAEQWGYYLNECPLAAQYQIIASYVPLATTNPDVAALLDQLVSAFTAFPEDENPQSRPTRREPGYWHIHAPYDPAEPYESLKGVLHFITAFRDLLLHGKAFWEKDG